MVFSDVTHDDVTVQFRSIHSLKNCCADINSSGG